MIDSDFRALRTLSVSDLLPATIAYVPNQLGGRYVGYLYLLASADGSVLGAPGIIGGVDDSEPDSASAEALIGCPIGPGELRRDGWYAEIQGIPAFQQTV